MKRATSGKGESEGLKPASSRLQALRAAGFDRSRLTHDELGRFMIRLGCSRCEAMAINGLACHEHGCPNRAQPARNEDE